jgi:hypothetical protein
MLGFRTRQIPLVPTRLDAASSRVADLAERSRRRWQGENSLGPLQMTRHMDVLHGTTATGVLQELTVVAIIDHVGRVVIWPSARLPQVDAARLSVLDARRWRETSGRGMPRTALLGHPARPARVEPRGQKRRPKAVPCMVTPRHERRQPLGQHTVGASLHAIRPRASMSQEGCSIASRTLN